MNPILVFDDDTVLASAISARLRHMGFNVWSASSYEVLDAMIPKSILVLTDMSGHEQVFDLCRKHRTDFITMSGDPTNHPLLLKPFDSKALRQAIEEALCRVLLACS